MPTSTVTEDQAYELASKFLDRMQSEGLLSRTKHEKYYRKPIVIAVGGFPGSGKTTAATELAKLTEGIHVQTNSIRQLLRELNMPWGQNVRLVRDVVVSELLRRKYAVIVDGGILEDDEHRGLVDVIREKRAELFIVGILADIGSATKWARERFRKRSISTFKDWLPNPEMREAYLASMEERRAKLLSFIFNQPDFFLLPNGGSPEDLLEHVRNTWDGIKTRI